MEGEEGKLVSVTTFQFKLFERNRLSNRLWPVLTSYFLSKDLTCQRGDYWLYVLLRTVPMFT